MRPRRIAAFADGPLLGKPLLVGLAVGPHPLLGRGSCIVQRRGIGAAVVLELLVEFVFIRDRIADAPPVKLLGGLPLAPLLLEPGPLGLEFGQRLQFDIHALLVGTLPDDDLRRDEDDHQHQIGDQRDAQPDPVVVGPRSGIFAPVVEGQLQARFARPCAAPLHRSTAAGSRPAAARLRTCRSGLIPGPNPLRRELLPGSRFFRNPFRNPFHSVPASLSALRLLGRTAVTGRFSGREEPRRCDRHRGVVIEFDDLRPRILPGTPDGGGVRSPHTALHRPAGALRPAAQVDELQLLACGRSGDGSALPLRRG